jgi:hypothetical protein
MESGVGCEGMHVLGATSKNIFTRILSLENDNSIAGP